MKTKLLLLLILPTNASALFDSYNAYKAYQSGKLESAEQQYASLAANNLDDWRPLYNLGTIALNQQKYEEAVTHLKKALALDSENKIIQERLAIAKKLRDEKKQDQQQNQESSPKNSKQQEKQKQNEQQSKEREQRSQQADQQKSGKPDEQKGQSDRKEQEKQQANNGNNDQHTRDAHNESKSSCQHRQQEREKDNADNNTEQQRQEPRHGTSHKEQSSQNQTSQKKLSQTKTLANDSRFSEEEKKFMEQLDKLDKQGQQQMLAIALAPSQAEQQFEDHNW